MRIQLINPETHSPYPSLTVNDRLCVAVPAGGRYHVSVGGLGLVRREVVLAVDGRDTLRNTDASPREPGIVVSGGTYLCRGFRTSTDEVAEFVCVDNGLGLSTAERRGTAACAGLIAAAVYAEHGYSHRPSSLESMPTRAMRGGGATAAGQSVYSPVGQTRWERGELLGEVVIQYDTPASWAAQGIHIPHLNATSPWPGARSAAFASRDSL